MDKDELDDLELVAAVAGGDNRAFDRLMERYKRPVLNFVYRMTADAAGAEDVAQEIFVKVYRGIVSRRFTPGTALFSTWLFRVARNAALDFLRSRKRNPAWASPGSGETWAEERRYERTPADDAVMTETAAEIAGAVALLPEDQRAALVLSEYEGLSNTQVAAILKCSGKSVESRLYRARRFLRKRLAHLIGQAL